MWGAAAVRALAGLVLLHALGAVLIALASRTSWRAALARPSSALVALAALYLVSLGAPGVGVLVVAAVATRWRRPRTDLVPARFPWPAFVALAALVLARPWVPTQWDEYVWLGKARLESLGFGAGVRAALDASQQLIPRGYPTLWPSAVGWVSLGHDALSTHTLAASLLVLLALAAALDAWAPLLPDRLGWPAIAAVLAVPLAWVHMRSTYVDLPLGLLGVALLGQLLRGTDARPPVEATALALVLVGFKDEGLAHVLAASAAAWLVVGRRGGAWRLVVPTVLALVATGLWRWLERRAGVDNVDHALSAPYWPWVPTLAQLLWRHASELFSWGVFWAVALAVLLGRPDGDGPRALRWLLLADLTFIAVELLCGPERVRVFAENGTLVNRLLMQAWPAAAGAVLFALATAPRSSSPRSAPAMPAA